MNTPSSWDNFIFVFEYEKLNTWRAKVEGFGSYFNGVLGRDRYRYFIYMCIKISPLKRIRVILYKSVGLCGGLI